MLCCSVAKLPITNLAGKVPSGPLGVSRARAYRTHCKFVCVCVCVLVRARLLAHCLLVNTGCSAPVNMK